MNLETLESSLNQTIDTIIIWSTSPQFYAQCGYILLAIITALSLTYALKKYSPLLSLKPQPGILFGVRNKVYALRVFLFPLFNIIALGIAVELSDYTVQQSWLVRIAQSLAVVFMLYSIITRFIPNNFIKNLVKWIAIPIAVLQVFGWLDEVSAYLDTIDMQVGNIRISAYALARVIVVGLILFWLGRVSNNAGQQIIRNIDGLEIGTREVFAKLFQVSLVVIIFILLLQAMGINLTALAVFGGALGVGLGFGLQAIASNFISGIIILLDKSITVGDHIELEDGRTGIIRELKMRSTTLETFDGKDIMVPNERFITSNFINWTHKNTKQRYSIEFQVAYKTDLDKLFELLREVVASHPQVISGDDIPIEERPDAEIAGFGDFGVDILVEFWMEGIDDGKNRVGADLLKMIWDAFKEHGIEFPFPQREVRILNPQSDLNLTK
ncbi:MAG: mechanosensitive ion channel family protein [Gammaproteobacteria bacterium]|jgi:small-conductance mechanosensitive channel